jgi:uncharacterized protein (TIGR02118 family)
VAKAIVLYNQPENAQAFDTHFVNIHTPIIKRFPGLRALNVSRGAINAPDGQSAYRLIVELEFDTPEVMRNAILASPEGQAAAKDLQNFAQAGVSLLMYDTITV